MCDLEVVRLLTRCVCTDEQAMRAESRARDFLDVGKPLSGEGRPFECAAVHDVVEENAVLLPYFVFFVDDLVVGDLLVGIIGLGRDW